MSRLCSFADRARPNIVFYSRPKLRPVKPAFDIRYGLVNPGMASEFMIMEGSENVESSIPEIRDIEASFVEDELSVSI